MIYSEKEVYLDIPGYEGSYQVSNYGNVKSLARVVLQPMPNGRTKRLLRKEKILKPGKLRGYLHLTLRKNNSSKIYKVHRLVLQTFNTCEGFEFLQVNHKDGDKSNNYYLNLEWVTPQENLLHMYRELSSNKVLSKYPYITKVRNRWRLRGFKNKHIGYFETEELAKEKYDSLVITNPELFKSITSNDLF